MAVMKRDLLAAEIALVRMLLRQCGTQIGELRRQLRRQRTYVWRLLRSQSDTAMARARFAEIEAGLRRCEAERDRLRVELVALSNTPMSENSRADLDRAARPSQQDSASRACSDQLARPANADR